MEKQQYYHKLQSKNYLLKHVNMLFRYFEADNVKKQMRENTVPVIYGGVFHNYVHVHKHLFCVM